MRNEDICESLGPVEVIGVINEKEEELEEAKGNELRQTWYKQLYEGGVLGRRPRGQPRKRWDDSFK